MILKKHGKWLSVNFLRQKHINPSRSQLIQRENPLTFDLNHSGKKVSGLIYSEIHPGN